MGRAVVEGAEPGVAEPAVVPAGDYACGRENDYKIPHMHKEKHERAGTLPWQVDCTPEAWAKGEAALKELREIEAGGAAAGSR